ncbi:class F sortase [Leifsonia lichenia]
MSSRACGRVRTTITIALAGAAVALLAACSAGASGVSSPTAKPTQHSVSAASGFQDPASPSSAPTVRGLAVTRVTIPSIGVDAPVELLDQDASGALLPPAQWQSAGWYRSGVVPGQVGPAVIAGHIDSDAGPAVFARLNELQPGASVTVTLSDASVVAFTVDHSIDVSKRAFPTQQVYGAVPTPQLRLISCTGVFDRAVGHYENNLVVFADLSPAR